MNKFKKVMLGALSVLTLGLFAVVGIKVNAAIVATDGSNSYLEYDVERTSATWTTKTPTTNKGYTEASDDLFGIIPITSFNFKKDVVAWEFPKPSNSVYSGAYVPVPSGAAGTLTITPSSENGGKRSAVFALDYYLV